MPEEAFLRGLVVVGGHEQRGVGAGFFRLDGEGDGFAGGVGAGAGDHFAAPGGELDGAADDVEVLLVVEGGRFAGGADGDDAVDARGDLRFDEGGEGSVVKGIVAKRRDERRDGAGKHRARLLRDLAAEGKGQCRPPHRRRGPAENGRAE